jgi:hypothetical protein
MAIVLPHSDKYFSEMNNVNSTSISETVTTIPSLIQEMIYLKNWYFFNYWLNGMHTNWSVMLKFESKRMYLDYTHGLFIT